MSVDASRVKELRDRTGAGMMDCKRALAESNGDLDRAIALLREKGLASASKKAGRVAAEGLVSTFTSADATRAVIAELNCETDFVAKTPEFGKLLQTVGDALLGADGIPAEGDGAAVATLRLPGGKTLGEQLNEAVASIGENINLRRYTRIVTKDGRIGGYVHAGGKIGVLVEMAGAGAAHGELLKSLAMQIAAAMPRCVRRSEVSAEELASEREIFRTQAMTSGKPANVVERIVDGKVEKFYREVCLLEQEYVRDPQLTIEKLLGAEAKASGAKLDVRRFVRYQLGEGIEKKTSNLAAEVAEQLAKG
jgi:elongation factor Ts